VLSDREYHSLKNYCISPMEFTDNSQHAMTRTKIEFLISITRVSSVLCQWDIPRSILPLGSSAHYSQALWIVLDMSTS
jgi:hypothetical protein